MLYVEKHDLFVTLPISLSQHYVLKIGDFSQSEIAFVENDYLRVNIKKNIQTYDVNQLFNCMHIDVVCEAIEAFSHVKNYYTGTIDFLVCLFNKQCVVFTFLFPSYLDAVENEEVVYLKRCLSYFTSSFSPLNPVLRAIFYRLAALNLGVLVSFLTIVNSEDATPSSTSQELNVKLFYEAIADEKTLNHIKKTFYRLERYKLSVPTFVSNCEFFDLNQLVIEQSEYVRISLAKVIGKSSFATLLAGTEETVDKYNSHISNAEQINETSSPVLHDPLTYVPDEFDDDLKADSTSCLSESENQNQLKVSCSSPRVKTPNIIRDAKNVDEEIEENMRSQCNALNKPVDLPLRPTTNVEIKETDKLVEPKNSAANVQNLMFDHTKYVQSLEPFEYYAERETLRCAFCCKFDFYDPSNAENICNLYHEVKNINDFIVMCNKFHLSKNILQQLFLLAYSHDLISSFEEVFALINFISDTNALSESYISKDKYWNSFSAFHKSSVWSLNENLSEPSKYDFIEGAIIYYSNFAVYSTLTISLLKVTKSFRQARCYLLPLILLASSQLKKRYEKKESYFIPTVDYIISSFIYAVKHQDDDDPDYTAFHYAIDVLLNVYFNNNSLLKMILKTANSLPNFSQILTVLIGFVDFRSCLMSISKKILNETNNYFANSVSKTEKLRQLLQQYFENSSTFIFSEADKENDQVNLKLLLDSTSADIKTIIADPFEPEWYLESLNINECRILKSSKYPILLSGNYVHRKNKSKPSIKRFLMYKHPDDLMMDYFVTEFFNYISFLHSEILSQTSFLNQYRVIATSSKDGFVEFVQDSQSFTEIEKEPNGISKIIDSNDKKHNFVTSAATFCFYTYLLGVGDRHKDNIMLRSNAVLFHVDYSFIFGNEPKYFGQVPMRITDSMVTSFGGTESKLFHKFVFLIVNNALWFKFLLYKVLPWFLMLQKGNFISSSDMTFLVERIKVFENDDLATIKNFIENIILKSIGNIAPAVIDYMHDLVLYFR